MHWLCVPLTMKARAMSNSLFDLSMSENLSESLVRSVTIHCERWWVECKFCFFFGLDPLNSLRWSWILDQELNLKYDLCLQLTHCHLAMTNPKFRNHQSNGCRHSRENPWMSRNSREKKILLFDHLAKPAQSNERRHKSDTEEHSHDTTHTDHIHLCIDSGAFALVPTSLLRPYTAFSFVWAINVNGCVTSFAVRSNIAGTWIGEFLFRLSPANSGNRAKSFLAKFYYRQNMANAVCDDRSVAHIDRWIIAIVASASSDANSLPITGVDRPDIKHKHNQDSSTGRFRWLFSFCLCQCAEWCVENVIGREIPRNFQFHCNFVLVYRTTVDKYNNCFP